MLKLDLIGKKFGRLTIYGVYYVKSHQNKNVLYCLCKCECGKIKEKVSVYSLKSGTTKSCGCYRKEIASERFFENLSGKKFNMLSVIERINNSKSGETRYLCLCECGNLTEVFSSNLKNGNTKSCGCYNIKLAKERCGEKSPNWKFGAYINNIPLYDTHAHQIEPMEETRRDPENSNFLQTKCVVCRKWFNPTLTQIQARRNGINFSKGEGRLYCSKECKQNCSIYKQIKYPKGYSQAISREMQPELRKLVLDRDNYECQKCGSNENLHCHHIYGIMTNPIESADLDNCITLCKPCHKYIHSQKGCTTYDYQCRE